MTDISIIIPSLNEEKNIGNILQDISRQNFHKSGIEVIVADAGSKDKTREIAEHYGVKIIPGGHPAIARNNGAKIASANTIYFIDADIRIRNNFLINTYQEFNFRKLNIAGIDNYPIYKKEDPFIDKILNSTFMTIGNYLFRLSEYFDKPKIVGTYMILDKKSFLEIGGFNENIYWAEDTELAQRMKSKGYKFAILRNENIFVSSRKPLSQGVIKYYLNVIKLNHYRNTKGEILSKEKYYELTGIKDYFKR